MGRGGFHSAPRTCNSPAMRLTPTLLLVLATGCLSTAAKTQLEAVGPVTVNPPIPPLQNPDVVKLIPGSDPVACAARDGGRCFVRLLSGWGRGRRLCLT